MSETLKSPRCRLDLHNVQTPGGYCSECATCQFCHKQLTVVEYNWCLSIAAKYETDPEFKHPACLSQIRQFDLASEQVTIPRVYFEYLNACRLLWEPLPDCNQQTNRIDAQIKVRQLYHELSIEDKLLAVVRMESAASEMSLILAPHKRELDLKFIERDKEKFDQAKRERLEHSVKAPKTKEKIEKQVASAEEKVQAKKALHVDKAVAALMHIGMTEDEATAIVAERQAKIKAKTTEVLQ